MKSPWNAQRSTKWEKDMVFDSWFRSLWNDRSKIPIKTHVRFTDETTVQNSQKSAWLFFVSFEQPKIRRKERGRFLVVSRWNFCTKRPAVVFRPFRRSSGLLGYSLYYHALNNDNSVSLKKPQHKGRRARCKIEMLQNHSSVILETFQDSVRVQILKNYFRTYLLNLIFSW